MFNLNSDAGFIQVTQNGKEVKKLTLAKESDLEISVLIKGEVDADGSNVTCLAQQIMGNSVKQLFTSVRISVLCKY